MRHSYAVEHHEHISARTFDEVVQAFEARVGSVEDGGFGQILARAAGRASEFEALVRAHEGTSEFMRFLTVDHGAWLSLTGLPGRARMYTIGNPLIARTMLEHDVAAGLNVPVRVLIYEHDDGVRRTARLAYDVPASLLSVLGNARVDAAARKLDAKLDALAVSVTGVEA